MPEQNAGETDGLSESLNVSYSKLVDQARRAYGQKRTKDCLDLTRAILLIDPENAEAQLMRSSIQTEMQQDLENARALLRNAHQKETPERNSAAHNTTPPAVPADSGGAESQDFSPDEKAAVHANPPVMEDLLIAAFKKSMHVSTRPEKRDWLVLAFVMIFFGLIVLGLTKFNGGGDTVQPAQDLTASGSPQVESEPEEPDELPIAAPVSLGSTAAILENPGANTAPPLATNVSPLPRPAPQSREAPAASAANGILAVSSPTSVDIYLDGAYIGSSPVSLELPAGSHTLEYRHENLRKSMTHVINGNETTRAMITFEVTVQVNAKPWAEVFLDGVERKPLGQTPLSGVRVPIGGVLVFENPAFQGKRYRVTGKETGIQVVFP